MRFKLKQYFDSLLLYVARITHLDHATPMEVKFAAAGIILLLLAPPAFLIVRYANPAAPSPETVIPINPDQQANEGSMQGESPIYGQESGGGNSGTGGSGQSGTGRGGVISGGSSRAGNSSSGGGRTPSGSNPGTPQNPAPARFESYCLARSGQVIPVNGLQKGQYRKVNITANTIFNAKSAYWDGTNAGGTPIPWVVTLDGTGPACWYGGRYQGVWDDTSPSVTWEDPYHHSGAMTIRMRDFLVESYRTDNQGDGVRMEGRGANFHIRGVHMSNIHDDCVENDGLNGGITEDSLFDGCYAGLSAADHTRTRNGSGNTWLLQNNLLRMKAYMTVHRVTFFTDRGCPVPNHMRVFKGWTVENPGPKVILKNNIFKFDIRPCGSGDFIPSTINLVECSNNIIVYTGPGNFPYSVPPCVTVTRDANVWNNAVARWKQTHPDAN